MPVTPPVESKPFPLVLAGLFLLAWSALCLLLGSLYPLLFGSAGDHPAAGIAAVTIFILLGSIGLSAWAIHVEPCLEVRPPHRTWILAATLVLAAVLYVAGSVTGWSAALGSANLLLLGTSVGFWLSRGVKRPAELVPVCLVMAMADLYSVLGGPTRKMAGELEIFYRGGMEGAVPAADYLLIKAPLSSGGALVPVFGVADWIMVAFFTGAALRLGLTDNLVGPSLGRMAHLRRPFLYLPVAGCALTLAVAGAHLLGLFLPALPVIALVCLVHLLAREPQARRLRRSDWALPLGFAVVFLGISLIQSALLPA